MKSASMVLDMDSSRALIRSARTPQWLLQRQHTHGLSNMNKYCQGYVTGIEVEVLSCDWKTCKANIARIRSPTRM